MSKASEYWGLTLSVVPSAESVYFVAPLDVMLVPVGKHVIALVSSNCISSKNTTVAGRSNTMSVPIILSIARSPDAITLRPSLPPGAPGFSIISGTPVVQSAE